MTANRSRKPGKPSQSRPSGPRRAKPEPAPRAAASAPRSAERPADRRGARAGLTANLAAARAAEPTHKLHKLLAQAGHGSRREMEELIAAGRVTVNDRVADVGTRVGPRDRVRVDGRLVYLHFDTQLPRILLYHKPEGEIVSRDDPEKRATVFDKLPRVRSGKWISVGRLDYTTSGLLIFTTSGELANRLAHPSFEVEREYAVRVMGELSPEQAEKLCRGVELEDGTARFEWVRDEGGEGSNHWYRVMLKEGRNREVRRLFEALGVMVTRLMRVRFGILALPPRLKRGQTVELDEAEVRRVLKWAGIEPPAERRSPLRRPPPRAVTPVLAEPPKPFQSRGGPPRRPTRTPAELTPRRRRTRSA